MLSWLCSRGHQPQRHAVMPEEPEQYLPINPRNAKADPSTRPRMEQKVKPGLVPAYVCLMLLLPAVVLTISAVTTRKHQLDQLARNTSAPVTYVNYYIEKGDVSKDMEVDHVWIRVPQINETHANGVFASSQFAFQRGHGGYMGTQVRRKGVVNKHYGWLLDSGVQHRVIFSIWDGSSSHKAVPATDATSLQNCDRFGGEGTGAHCSIEYPIQKTKITIRMYHGGRGDSGDIWTGVLRIPTTGEEVTIGSIFLPDMAGEGFGMLEPYRSNSAFQEYWDATGCEDQALSIVGIFGPYFSGRSEMPSKAEPKYNKACMRDDVSDCIPGFGCGRPRVLLTAGSLTVPHAKADVDIWSSAEST